MAPPISVGTSGGTATTAGNKDKGKDKGKAKAKASDTESPTTVAPVTPDVLTPDTVFDPSTLTPGPGLAPDAPEAPRVDDVNLESAGILNLLDGEEDDPADYGPLLLALGALALVLSIGGLCIWFGHHSRYDPA
jgi:hypothetical protein